MKYVVVFLSLYCLLVPDTTVGNRFIRLLSRSMCVCVRAGSVFAAPGGAVFAGLHSVYMYGGLVLFGGYMLYDTQKIVHHAENDVKYDPINR